MTQLEVLSLNPSADMLSLGLQLSADVAIRFKNIGKTSVCISVPVT